MVYCVTPLPPVFDRFGAGLGGQVITNNCKSLLDTPIKLPFLYSLISTATTKLPVVGDIYCVNPVAPLIKEKPPAPKG